MNKSPYRLRIEWKEELENWYATALRYENTYSVLVPGRVEYTIAYDIDGDEVGHWYSPEDWFIQYSSSPHGITNWNITGPVRENTITPVIETDTEFADWVNLEGWGEKVNSPDHYTTGGIETIDYIYAKLSTAEFRGYCIGNVLKYVSRAKKKGGKNDLEKAKKYLDWAIGYWDDE